MARVLILGGGGMLGHKLWQVCRAELDAHVTLRSPLARYARLGLFEPDRTIDEVDVEEFPSVERAVTRVAPEVVVNCVGVVKQLEAARDPVVSIAVNALFPHRLARLTASRGIRLVHVSTDCVFAGTRAGYTEDDRPDADDLYGRTKALGEVTGPGCLTLRTSIVGRELEGRLSLVEWFLAQRGGQARGFTRAIFSGLTTLAFSRVVRDLIRMRPSLAGLYHVSAEPISKHDLLRLLDECYHAGVRIEPSAELSIDRSLSSDRFRRAAGFAPMPWPEMVREMAADPTPYDAWRSPA